MRFSPSPPLAGGDTGFTQWRDAMKMVARLPGGIPSDFRRKLWLALSEKHLQSRGVNWTKEEKICFNEWTNPDDSELGIQIVKVIKVFFVKTAWEFDNLPKGFSRIYTEPVVVYFAVLPDKRIKLC